MRALRTILIVLVLTAASNLMAAEREIGNPWPAVAPVARAFSFADAEKASVNLTLVGKQGQPLYALECRSGSYSGSDESLLDYSGLLDCRLHSLNSEAFYKNLLVSSFIQWSDWWANRGRFLTSDLVGKCAGYPEYGSVRHLSLRSMEITLAIDNIKFGSASGGRPVVKSYRFTVRVRPDPTALSSIAAAVPYADPDGIPARCAKVTRKHIPGIITEGYIRSEGLQPPYPPVATAEGDAVFPVVDQGPGKAFRLPIRAANGKQAYVLKCSGGVGVAGVGEWGILCKLVATGKKLNLLGDSVDPFSRAYRGLITTEQLTPSCDNYPEWGSVRHFKLRGFKLTLRASMRTAREGTGSSVVLRAKVRPDPSAISAVALPARYVDWRFLTRPHACEQILTRFAASKD